MQRHYTINELAKLYQIPKSKIRFWEKKRLLSPVRDAENDYRLYDIKDVYDIGDITIYREMGISIKRLQNLKTADFYELRDIISDAKNDIEAQMEQLDQSKQALTLKLEKLELIQNLEKNPYQEAIPPFDALVPYDFDDQTSAQLFLTEHYGYGLAITLNTEIIIKEVFIKPKQWEGMSPIWLKQEGRYLTAILKTSPDDYMNNNLSEHMNYLAQQEIKVNQVVATYLSSFFRGERYDFYQAWFECSD